MPHSIKFLYQSYLLGRESHVQYSYDTFSVSSMCRRGTRLDSYEIKKLLLEVPSTVRSSLTRTGSMQYQTTANIVFFFDYFMKIRIKIPMVQVPYYHSRVYAKLANCQYWFFYFSYKNKNILLVVYPDGTIATTSNASMLNQSTAIILRYSSNCLFCMYTNFKHRSIIIHSSTVRRSLTGIILYQTTANIVFLLFHENKN